MDTTSHAHWMALALERAREAARQDEVPVGALLVRGGEVLGEGSNRPVSSHDPTAHAEIIALREAAWRKGNYRLPGSTLYVTIEPCTMCVGAIIHARVDTLVFGAREPRYGAVVSARRLLDSDHYNHHPAVVEGILADECGDLMRGFFRARRNRQ
ncbi:MAG: tRNA adenosine(34) deaminase TadA [Pseudohongiellaceae bacterium]